MSSNDLEFYQALRPASDANKYTRGKLVVFAGSARYPGAAVLAARAGQRMGAGYTEVFTSESAVQALHTTMPSIVVRPFDDWDSGSTMTSTAAKPCAVCLGSGFVAREAKSDALALKVLKAARCPVLVDGGALERLGSGKFLARLAKRADKGYATVLTPHGGEAARLAEPLQLRSASHDKLAAALALATRSLVVLKGPVTYISDGTQTLVMAEGTPALAKAGTGDVLAGMITAILAQGIEPCHAAVLGTTLHARAGLIAAERLTDICVTAEDVIESIPQALGKQ